MRSARCCGGLVTALTFGLAYPFQLASLERYKMRNTYYGDLAGRFAGSAFSLFAARVADVVPGLVAPLAVAVGAFIEVVDWKALGEALAHGGNDVMSKIESGNPQLAARASCSPC